MSAVTPREIVLAAQAGGYAVGAFNMHNPETTQALIQAAQLAHLLEHPREVPPPRAVLSTPRV